MDTRTAFTAGINIPHSMLDYILIGAFEGGINYWCCRAQDGHPDTIKRIRDLEGENSQEHCWYADYEHTFLYKLWDVETGKPFKVGQKFNAVRNGKVLEVKYRHLDFIALREGIQMWIQQAVEDEADCDFGNMDAAVYDQIVQLAVFGGAVFG